MNSEKEYVVNSHLEPVDIYEGSLASLLWTSMKKHVRKLALIESESKKSFTFTTLMETAENVASHLVQLGLHHGDIVTFYSTNCLEYVVLMLAVWRAGGAVALINYMATPADLQRELGRLQAEVLFTNDVNVHKAIEGSMRTKVKTIISTSPHLGCISFKSMASSPAVASLPDIDRLPINPREDTAAILFSSGTTGLPKAVQLTHRNICAEVAYIEQPCLESPRDVYLVFQPLAHIYGVNMAVSAVAGGASLVVMPSFSLERYIEHVIEYKVSLLTLVPPVSVALVQSGLLARHAARLAHVTSVKNASAPMSPVVEAQISAQLGRDVHFKQTFGMTETNGMIVGVLGPHHGHLHQPRHAGSLGVLMPGVQAKILDPESAKALGPECRGEMCFRSPTNMKGYLGDTVSTTATIDSGGWLHTGDIGYYDDRGCFYIVDRIKDIIKYNAMQVSPSELESVIRRLRGVADVAVLGRPHPAHGELPAALVVRAQHGAAPPLTEAQVHAHVDAHVANYKRLRGGVVFVANIPKSPSGKILRRQLGSHLAAAGKAGEAGGKARL